MTIKNYKFSKYFIYYKLADEDHKLRIITNDGKLDTIDKYEHNYTDYNDIELKHVNDVKPSDEVLREYLISFEIWKEECFKNGIYKLDITQGDIFAYQQCFFYLVQNYKDKKTKKFLHDRITSTEYKLFEKCANNAMLYLVEDDIEVQCWSYDRKMAYANIMGSYMKVPTKEGKEFTYKNKHLPSDHKDLQYGFHRVKITYTNKDFLKVFTFSKNNVYVDISLRFAIEVKDQFGLTIEYIQDGKPNAYVYDYDDMIGFCSMTYHWLDTVKQLKAKYPKNPYIKGLASKTWGFINQRNKIVKTRDEINDNNMDYGLTDDHKYVKLGEYEKNGVDYYEMVDTANAYRSHIRLKPWITAQARVDIARHVLKHLDSVVRICCDSISFNKNIEINDENYVLEDKTSGLIHWKDSNAYYNKTTGYKSKTYDKRR